MSQQLENKDKFWGVKGVLREERKQPVRKERIFFLP